MMSDFDIVRKDKVNRGGGGTAILINRSIKYRQIFNVIDCSGKLEMYAVEIFVQRESLILMSFYRPPQTGTINIKEWLDFFIQFGDKKVFFGGDFNASNLTWGLTYTYMYTLNPTGKNMWEVLLYSKFSLLNNGFSTYLSV